MRDEAVKGTEVQEAAWAPKRAVETSAACCWRISRVGVVVDGVCAGGGDRVLSGLWENVQVYM